MTSRAATLAMVAALTVGLAAAVLAALAPAWWVSLPCPSGGAGGVTHGVTGRIIGQPFSIGHLLRQPERLAKPSSVVPFSYSRTMLHVAIGQAR